MESERGFERERDWTQGPAKWAAVVVLGTACVLTSAWVMTGRVGARIEREAIAAKAPTTQAQPAPAPAKPPAPLALAGEPVGPPADIARTEESPGADAQTSTTPTESADSPGIARRININTATAAELELLPGVGPKLAGRIIEHRRAHGAFKSVDGLDAVSGIGPRILERLRGMVTVD